MTSRTHRAPASWLSHALLLVEATAGTFAPDSLCDDMPCWDEIPFNFQSPERPDGRWTRFDQRFWKRRH